MHTRDSQQTLGDPPSTRRGGHVSGRLPVQGGHVPSGGQAELESAAEVALLWPPDSGRDPCFGLEPAPRPLLRGRRLHGQDIENSPGHLVVDDFPPHPTKAASAPSSSSPPPSSSSCVVVIVAIVTETYQVVPVHLATLVRHPSRGTLRPRHRAHARFPATMATDPRL